MAKKLLDLPVLMSDPVLLYQMSQAGVNPRLLEIILDRFGTQKQGKTILLVEHNMDLVMGISDKVVVMAWDQLYSGTPMRFKAANRF